MSPVKEDKNSIILFLALALMGVCLAAVARAAAAKYYLAFFWSRNFPFLIKVVLASAFYLLLLRWTGRQPLSQKILKTVYGVIFLPVLLLPVFRCCFKVPYIFCRMCPDKCPWGISRTFLFGSFLTLNLSGRFWCYSMCPFGTFQECQAKSSNTNIAPSLRAGILAYPALVFTGWAYSLTLLASGTMAFFEIGYYGWVGITVAAAALILVVAFFIPRFWCRCLCPVGSIAELAARLRRKSLK